MEIVTMLLFFFVPSISNNDDKSGSGKKSDWLRSVQLWNQAPDPPTTNEEHQISKPTKVSVVELKRNGGAFQPFNKQKATQVGSTPAPVVASVCSTAEAAADKEGEGQLRKSRRCWSPELHRRFLNALQQFGGSHVATPKQIKELMKVDGLTNDEVKSHLQGKLKEIQPEETSPNKTEIKKAAPVSTKNFLSRVNNSGSGNSGESGGMYDKRRV